MIGFGALGASQANRLRRIDQGLAKAVAECWSISPEVADTAAGPAADTLLEYLPARMLENTCRAILPIQAVAAVALIYQQCAARQTEVVRRWQEAHGFYEPEKDGEPATGDPAAEYQPEPGTVSDMGGVPPEFLNGRFDPAKHGGIEVPTLDVEPPAGFAVPGQ